MKLLKSKKAIITILGIALLIILIIVVNVNNNNSSENTNKNKENNEPKETKEKLYLYNVDDLDYSIFKTQYFSYKSNNETTSITLYDDYSLNYYSTVNDGTTITDVKSNDSAYYRVNGDTLTLVGVFHVTKYKKSYYGDRRGNTYEADDKVYDNNEKRTITFKIGNNYKSLESDNKVYNNLQMNRYNEQNTKQVYIDYSNIYDYYVDSGILIGSICDTNSSTYSADECDSGKDKTAKIDVNNYEVVDMTTNPRFDINDNKSDLVVSDTSFYTSDDYTYHNVYIYKDYTCKMEPLKRKNSKAEPVDDRKFDNCTYTLVRQGKKTLLLTLMTEVTDGSFTGVAKYYYKIKLDENDEVSNITSIDTAHPDKHYLGELSF